MAWWGWLALVAGAWVAFVLALLLMGRREDIRAIARTIGDAIASLRRTLADPAVPRSRKVVLWLALAYVLMPIDLVPDFLPVIGQLDDVIVVALALRFALRD